MIAFLMGIPSIGIPIRTTQLGFLAGKFGREQSKAVLSLIIHGKR